MLQSLPLFDHTPHKAVRFVSVDHDTPTLLPPDLRDWVPAEHIVHFAMDAVKLPPTAPKQEPGTKEQYNFAGPENRLPKKKCETSNHQERDQRNFLRDR